MGRSRSLAGGRGPQRQLTAAQVILYRNLPVGLGEKLRRTDLRGR